jgi:hypothetical protein
MPTTFSRTLRSLESVSFMHMEILRRRSNTDFLLMLPMNEALTGGAFVLHRVRFPKAVERQGQLHRIGNQRTREGRKVRCDEIRPR